MKVLFIMFLTNPYRNVGAVVEVFDISCMVGSALFNNIQTYAFDIWVNMSASETTQDLIEMLGNDPLVLGQHYFITNPVAGGTAISPVWDFTSNAEKGDAGAFVLAALEGEIPAPTGQNDVDWKQLKRVKGELADTIYRVDTKGGQPPESVSWGALCQTEVSTTLPILCLLPVQCRCSVTVGQVRDKIL